jgi:hypothetical protein
MAQIKKTDKSYLADKIHLRANHLPEGDIRVLDAFAGAGKIWSGVAYLSERKIRRLPIDKRDDIGFHLPGDNLAYLGNLDLSRFNAIDLDAYGIPFQQLKEVFESKFSGWVYVTFIQVVFGALPIEFLGECGFTEEMIKKSPALFYKRGWEYFINWLAMRGVQTIYHRQHKRKHYLAFYLSGAAPPGADLSIRPGEMVVNRA